MKRLLKPILAMAVLAATVAAFVYYVARHPETLTKLKQLPPLTLAGLLLLNIVSFGCFVWVTRASLGLYGKKMGRQENLLFNAYSSLVNFFGPGQSGPVFRGAYLKRRLDLGVKQYIFGTLVYYGFFAVISVLFMFAGARPWWQTGMLALATGAASVAAIRWYKARAHIAGARLDMRHIGWIGGATLLQLLAQVALYGLELHATHAQASFGQVLSYTGVANLAIFVALTPGAIGVREAFLLFSERLHHIGSASIVAANVVDRGVYVVFLGLLFVLVLSLHAKKKLGVSGT
ncbi:MAG TPA: lysylphosphatidylglycerol synthase domain-containing protein [Candidatus Saccharimonadales bacterium]|nr:lysylphosphatidylglycerol synthase domain-containing protein [Candidatus Saccharimonadales bacterium]